MKSQLKMRYRKVQLSWRWTRRRQAPMSPWFLHITLSAWPSDGRGTSSVCSDHRAQQLPSGSPFQALGPNDRTMAQRFWARQSQRLRTRKDMNARCGCSFDVVDLHAVRLLSRDAADWNRPPLTNIVPCFLHQFERREVHRLRIERGG